MILPFSIGCVSQSSVAVAEDRSSSSLSTRKSNLLPDLATSPRSRDAAAAAADKMASHGKSSSTATGFLPLPPRPNLTAGFQRVIKGFRGFTSHLFAYKPGGSSDDEEEEERELQIGFPTDVQHVGHIGWDGTNTNALSTIMAWDGYRKQKQPPPPAPPAAPDLITMPSISLRQFHMAMAAQTQDDNEDAYPNTSSRPPYHHLRTAAPQNNGNSLDSAPALLSAETRSQMATYLVAT